MSDRLIAITGGIGAGKSVVARMLRAIGCAVYDCDSRAKLLMDVVPGIKQEIAERICCEAINPDGSIDRKILADIVFNDAAKLDSLNRIVHDAVRRDILCWSSGKSVAFVETAILYQSGLDRMVDEVWEVTAPKEIRILRAMARNGAQRSDIEARIEAQERYDVESVHPKVRVLINDGDLPLLPQVEHLLASSISG